MTDIQLNDAVFDQPEGWTPFYKDDRYEQRLRIVNDTFFCETLVAIRSSPAGVLPELLRPWDWWAHGTIISSKRHPDGSLEMEFKPIWWYVARMSLLVLPPENAPDICGTRLPIVYSGGFEGPGSIDVYAHPSGDGRSILRGRCHGVRNHVRMLFANETTAAWAHLWTESGRMMLPFTRGTGYAGLVRRIEGAAGTAREGR